MAEFKGIVQKYNGSEVDEKQLGEWYDCQGESDGKISTDEFR